MPALITVRMRRRNEFSANSKDSNRGVKYWCENMLLSWSQNDIGQAVHHESNDCGAFLYWYGVGGFSAKMYINFYITCDREGMPCPMRISNSLMWSGNCSKLRGLPWITPVSVRQDLDRAAFTPDICFLEVKLRKHQTVRSFALTFTFSEKHDEPRLEAFATTKKITSTDFSLLGAFITEFKNQSCSWKVINFQGSEPGHHQYGHYRISNLLLQFVSFFP